MGNYELRILNYEFKENMDYPVAPADGIMRDQ